MKTGNLLPFSGLSFLSGNSIRESDQEYCRVILYLNDSERVIVCRDEIQWIFQRRQGTTWRGVFYFRTEQGLSRYPRLSEAVSTAGLLRCHPDAQSPAERPSSVSEGVS